MFLTPGSKAARWKLPFIHETSTGLTAPGSTAARNGAVPQGLHLYETYINDSNWRRALFDFNTVGPATPVWFGSASIGSVPKADLILGTGSAVSFRVSGATFFTTNNSFAAGTTRGSFDLWSSGAYGWADVNFNRQAAGVIGVGTSTAGVPSLNTSGWFNWGGQARVASPFSVTSSTVLTNVTGLSLALIAGRIYTFSVEIPYTCAAAGGIQVAMAASGGLTATDIHYDGYLIDSGANGIKGNAQAAALGTAVASSTTSGTAGHVSIKGGITVNVAGTLNVQMAQNTSSGTATVALQGAYMLAHDMGVP